MKEKIVLEFDSANWKHARWVINCFQAGVWGSYAVGAPRRVEADKLAEELHAQLRAQVGEDYDT